MTMTDANLGASAELIEQLRARNDELVRQLDEAQAALRAIAAGEIDALVVGPPGSQRIYTLEGADRPYRLWVERMQQGAATVQRDGTLLYCNRHFAELLGCPSEALLGVSLHDFVAHDCKATFDALLADAAGGGAELTLLRADGTPYPALVVPTALELDIAAIGLLVTDLTVQKHHDELARALADRQRLEAELRQAVADLYESDRRKSEFLAVLAHELRNPLAPVTSGIELLQHGGAIDANATLQMMRRQVKQMARLIDDLLDVSRINRGKVELRRAPVMLGAIVQEAFEAIRQACADAGQRLVIRHAVQPIHLLADSARLLQVIGNLLHNAHKFTATGGTIEVETALVDDVAELRVRDTGIGIPADQLERVFELFEQVDGSRERSQGGLGLGLTLVRTLVEMHGGSVRATSAGIDRGSEFVVTLPAMQPVDAAPAKVGTTQPPSAATSAKLVLIVDDNRDAADTLALVLQLAGHTVETAYDGEAAVEAALRLRPQVVLLDIGLPKIDGYEVARRLRALGMTDTQLVAVSGWGQDEDRRRSRESGFDLHLVKPVDPRVMEKLIGDPPPR